MTATSLQNMLDELLQDRSLREPDQLARRIDALERLERLLVHAGEGRLFHHRCQVLADELEAINRALYRSVRDAIRRGDGADTLRAWTESLRGVEDADGYDALDALVGGVLDFQEPDAVPELEADMVFYQPTPARHIFDFIARAQISERDVVMDLGAGLGHVTLLTAICTGARCIGVELQPAYVESARACASALRVRHACFVAQDVRQADLSAGTVFYLYTPFTGAMLRSVLDLLRQQAMDRAIRVCTLGPCTAAVAKESWLEAMDIVDAARPVVFRVV